MSDRQIINLEQLAAKLKQSLGIIQKQDIQIRPEDKVEVTGSKVDFSGQSAVMAASVKKGDTTLMLRDDNGFPVWHGWRGGRFNR